MPHPPKPGSQALRKGRRSLRNQAYLVTFVTENRIPWFQQFDLAFTCCRLITSTTKAMDANPLCWVLMPDHVHLMVQIGDLDLSEVVRRLKAGSALVMNRRIGRRGRFWAPGFHDHGIRYEEDLRSAARYIVANPLRAGLANKVGDYPWWDAVWL